MNLYANIAERALVTIPADQVKPGDIHQPYAWSTPAIVEGVRPGCAGSVVLDLATDAGTRFSVGFWPDRETGVMETTRVWRAPDPEIAAPAAV